MKKERKKDLIDPVSRKTCPKSLNLKRDLSIFSDSSWKTVIKKIL